MQMGKFQKITTPDRIINQIQDNTARILNPLTSQPLNTGAILSNVVLINGATSVNHLLGRPLQGWFIVRMRDVYASVYDIQGTNQTPALTLDLVSNAAITVDLFVF